MARKRRPTKREANGRPQRASRAAIAEAATLVALGARQRLYGAPEAILRDAKMCTVIGRLELSGLLGADILGDARAEWSARRYETALGYVRLHAAYMRAIGAPEQPREPRSDEDPPRPCEECGLTIRCEPCAGEAATKIRAKWGSIQAALIAVRYPDLADAMDVVVMRDHWEPELLDPLRRALDLICDML